MTFHLYLTAEITLISREQVVEKQLLLLVFCCTLSHAVHTKSVEQLQKAVSLQKLLIRPQRTQKVKYARSLLTTRLTASHFSETAEKNIPFLLLFFPTKLPGNTSWGFSLFVSTFQVHLAEFASDLIIANTT